MSRRTSRDSSLSQSKGKPMPERDKNDHYPTPWQVIWAALMDNRPTNNYARILDLGAGSGRWGTVARHFMPAATVIGIEKQHIVGGPPSAYSEWYKMDILKYLEDVSKDVRPFVKFNQIIGNLPFYLFDQRYVGTLFSLLDGCLRPGGRVIFFARAALAESETRYNKVFSWWPPKSITSYVKRVSFYPEGHPRCGDTNARHHCLFEWEKMDRRMGGATEYLWEPRSLNDNHYTFEHPFRGKITWQDMIAMGLVTVEAKENV